MLYALILILLVLWLLGFSVLNLGSVIHVLLVVVVVLVLASLLTGRSV